VIALIAAMRLALNMQLSFSQCVGCCTLEVTTVCETEQISQNGMNCPEFSDQPLNEVDRI
jgi:hypothetical protein